MTAIHSIISYMIEHVLFAPETPDTGCTLLINKLKIIFSPQNITTEWVDSEDIPVSFLQFRKEVDRYLNLKAFW